jgi:RimJ/RimL family protein N-acetyltransferase
VNSAEPSTSKAPRAAFNAPHHPRIQTSRLLLRQVQDQDLPFLIPVRCQPESTRYMTTHSEESARDYYHQVLQPWFGEENRWLCLVMERKDGILAGEIVCRFTDLSSRVMELGYIVHPSQQRQGLALEAATALLHYGFATLAVAKWIAICDVRNGPSHALMEKLGMLREAHFRSHQLFKGERVDLYHYGLLPCAPPPP